MSEKTICKEDSRKRSEKETEKSPAEELETDEQGNWSEDQRNKSYYYDDSYGYEVYDADEDE